LKQYACELYARNLAKTSFTNSDTHRGRKTLRAARFTWYKNIHVS